MNEEENNGQQEVQDSKLKQVAGRAGKQVAHEAERQAKKVIAEAIKKALTKVVAVLGAKGLLILAIVLAIIAAVTIGIAAIDDFLDGEVARTADEVTNNAMDEYCTIDEYGVHFDKDKFVSIFPQKLKEEVGIDFNDLGLGSIMVDPTGYFLLNPNSQAAEYLYKYMAAALSSELPYIEGSDEETKGIIKIKRTLNSTEYSDSTLQPPAESTVTPITKTIDTASYGLSAEEVNITMDNIKNEYKIAWVSDLHMMHPDQPAINTEWYSRQGTTFEERNSVFNNSYLILDNIINCLKENDFDAIIFGGDMMDNYSDKNFEYLKTQIERLSGKEVMFLVADHDYLTEMTTNTGVNKAASNLGVSGDIKKITIGKDGDSINLVGQNYSNEQISDNNVSTIDSYLNETENSLFFTHVPVESKTQASSMQEWSRNVHNGQVYYWSSQASSSGYTNPSENYLNTLYNSTSLKGVFAGHVHVSGDFELNTGIKEHIFKASFNNSIGVITLTPSGSGQTTPVEIIEDSNNTEEIELEYIGYSQLQDMINSDEISVKKQSLRYFSLDSSWNLCVTKWRSTSENGQETSFEVYEVKIPYRRMVSQYTIPFTFLMDLQLISQNANYVEAVSKLMTDRSYIDFTIFDSVTTDETRYTYEATINTKTKHIEFNPTTMTSYETGTYDKTTEQEGPDVTVTKIETDTIKASVTKAKTWIIDQTITYNLQESREYPYGAEPGKVEESSEPEPEGEGSWRDPIKETWYEEIIKREWVKGAVETKFMPDEFLGLWSNKTGTYVKGASYLPATEASGGKLVEYNSLEGNRMEIPVTNIIPSREQLYDLLAGNQTTQTHSEMMKEIINFYLTGDELTEGSLDIKFEDIFAPLEYNESTMGTGNVHETKYTLEEFVRIVRAYKPPNQVNSKTGVLYQTGYDRYFIPYAEVFYNVAVSYNLNPEFIFCIGIHESGYGTSRIIMDKNNAFGYGAVDGNAYNAAWSFPSMKEGIEQECYDLATKFLDPSHWKYQTIVQNGYNPDTIDGIGSLYASDGGWARKVKSYMQTIFGYSILGDEITGGSETVGTDAQAVVELAKAQVGKPYVWGAGGPNSFDCSGLVMWVYKQVAGIDIPHGTSYYPSTFAGRERSLSELKPGDILWRSGHTGIYIGNGKCVEAKGKDYGVVISDVSKKGFTRAFYVFK